MYDGNESIADDELLYRRITVNSGWYSSESGLSPQAFAPHKTRDVTGISVDRAKYKSIQDAAQGLPGKSYFVAVLNAGDLQRRGIAVVPRPEPGNEGHAELPDLNAASCKSERTLELQLMLVELTRRVEGPFGPQSQQQD